MGENAEPLLTGKASKDIRVMAEEYPTDKRKRCLKFFSKFFMVRDLCSCVFEQQEYSNF